MTRAQTHIALAAVGIVAALAGALLARNMLQARSNARANAPVLASGTLIEPAKLIPSFTLIDQDNSQFTPDRLHARWTLMFFGFTNCGDVCPTTLTLLASVSKSLANLPEQLRPQIVFVSVDAQRDSPQVIKEYLRHFDPDFVGVTGKQSDLDAFTQALGVPSAIRSTDNGYAVDHSASILTFNPRGAMQAIFSPPHAVDTLARDFRTLIELRR
jgi:protein SCO1/2